MLKKDFWPYHFSMWPNWIKMLLLITLVAVLLAVTTGGFVWLSEWLAKLIN